MLTNKSFNHLIGMRKVTLGRSQDSKLLGVCAGLGEYFGIDPVLFRVSFVLSVLGLGFGILPYLILYFALPKHPED